MHLYFTIRITKSKEVNRMEPALRIHTCHVLEKMKQDEAYTKRLGLADDSKIVWKKSGTKSRHTGNHKKTNGW